MAQNGLADSDSASSEQEDCSMDPRGVTNTTSLSTVVYYRANPHQCRLEAIRGVESTYEIGVLLVGKRGGGSAGQLGLVLRHESGVDLNLRGSEGRRCDEFEVVVTIALTCMSVQGRRRWEMRNAPDELAGEPVEGLLKVEVGLGGDLEVLEVPRNPQVSVNVTGECEPGED